MESVGVLVIEEHPWCVVLSDGREIHADLVVRCHWIHHPGAVRNERLRVTSYTRQLSRCLTQSQKKYAQAAKFPEDKLQNGGERGAAEVLWRGCIQKLRRAEKMVRFLDIFLRARRL